MLAKDFDDIIVHNFKQQQPAVHTETSWSQFYEKYYLSDTLAIIRDKVFYSRWCLIGDSTQLTLDKYYRYFIIYGVYISSTLITVGIHDSDCNTEFLRFQNTQQNMDQIKKVADFLHIPLDK